MKVCVYDSHKFEKEFLSTAAKLRHELLFHETRLNEQTVQLAEGADAVCLFVNDDASAPVIERLSSLGIKFMALRSAGFNHVDLEAARLHSIKVANVPDYSPYAVAEHTVALMLALNRRLIRAHHRITELNFSLDGLVGFDMHGKTVGIIGLGKIGSVVAKILKGFGCTLLVHDPRQNAAEAEEIGFTYCDLSKLCRESEIITLHLPLNNQTKYIINRERIAEMKPGVMLINTSRGGLLNTKDVIAGLKSRHIGYVGLDVYEEEQGLFFEDHSDDILEDDIIARLLSFRNVLVTSHQAFLTTTALENIARVTMENLSLWEQGLDSPNEITSII